MKCSYFVRSLLRNTLLTERLSTFTPVAHSTLSSGEKTHRVSQELSFRGSKADRLGNVNQNKIHSTEQERRRIMPCELKRMLDDTPGSDKTRSAEF